MAFVVATSFCMAQSPTVNLCFVGTDLDGMYKRLSYVTVENLSRGWTETIVYPDTLLTLTASVGIAQAEDMQLSLSGYPNPFKGNTMVSLQMSQSDYVLLQIFDIRGRRIAQRGQTLEAGKHTYSVSLSAPQLYILVASTSQGHSTIKLLNQSPGGADAITDCGFVPSERQKMLSSQFFVLGDFMRYTGYIVNGADTLGSNIHSQIQTGSEIVLLEFAEKPTVTTALPDSLTGTSARCGGEVVDDGGAVVYQRGVCWSTSPNPTCYNNHTTDGVGNGAFVSAVTGLVPGTTYYLRAYATNTAGTSYGSQRTLTTPALPTVTTATVTAVGVDTAICGGNVTNDGGSPVTARGVCWSTVPNPTIADNITTDSNGAGAFVSHITQIATGTTYYVRAYATNVVGTAYGNQQTFSTLQLPVLTTNPVTTFRDTTATFSATLTSHGDAAVTVRGFCWDTIPNPVVGGSHTTDLTTGIGLFTDSVNTLAMGTTYYMRAYATSALGTGYGQTVTFSTYGTPTVVTDSVGRVTTTSAAFFGNVTFDGGQTVSSRGFCWSTFPNPTVSDNMVLSGNGAGTFTSAVSRLTPGTVYYVRAFAVNVFGVGYGNTVVVNTVNPEFSVSPLRTIGFSTGNLQYSASGRHATADSTALGVFRFAPNQYDTVGAANSSISDTTTAWIDLFGWGTSGCNGRQPYLNSTSRADYDNGYSNLSGTAYDWGTYNAILNGGNQPGQWFTMNSDEWQYLINQRDGAENKKGYATVCGVPGILLLPDSWSNPMGTFFVTGYANGYATNVYNAYQWDNMESYGAVFLPAAGLRTDSVTVSGVGGFGNYWTSTADSNTNTKFLSFASDRINVEGYHNNQGRSVRLVRLLAELPSVTTDSLHGIISDRAVAYGTLVGEGRNSVTACGFCWSTSPNPTINDNVAYARLNSPAAGSYSLNLPNLMSGTKYYIRFFAVNGDGVGYGNEQIFTTLGNGVTGKFSISAYRKVRFAHGNLQYSEQGSHVNAQGDTVRGKVQFAWNQYDYVGDVANSLISDTNRGWIDLFGWATSGSHYVFTQASVADSMYGVDSADIDGTTKDWGVQNVIYSPLLDVFFPAGTWRTFTKAEMVYLMHTRPMADGKVGCAIVSGQRGLVILPDEWIQPATVTFIPGFYNYFANIYQYAQWTEMENNGAVFLPFAGTREGTAASNAMYQGAYWTSTADGVQRASFFTFTINNMEFNLSMYRHMGLSVRLVRDEQNW